MPGLNRPSVQSQSNLARYQLGGKNRSVYESMGNRTPQQRSVGSQADSILSGGQAPSQGDMSGFGLRGLRATQIQQQPLNARGNGSFAPSDAPVNANVGTSQGGLGYVENIHGGRRRFFEGRGGRTIDTIDPATGTVTPGQELGYVNSGGGRTIIGRTPNGGLSFTGTGGRAMTPELQARLNDRSAQRRDDRILGNAVKYRLSGSLPAVAGAVRGTTARGKVSAQKQALVEAIMQQHMEHAASLPTPFDRIKYLQDLHDKMSGVPKPNVAPRRGGLTINPNSTNPILDFDFGLPGL